MRFSKPNCPECGEDADGILERLYAVAELIRHDKSDVFDYAGGSRVDWDTQEPDEDKNGLVYLKCSNRHEWESKVDYTDSSTPLKELFGEDKANGETAAQA